MEFKGSKGNWHIRETSALNENGKPLYYDVCIENQSFISTFKNEIIGENDDTQLANAKLISCAPEMLEMLNKIVNGEIVVGYEIEELIIKATTI